MFSVLASLSSKFLRIQEVSESISMNLLLLVRVDANISLLIVNVGPKTRKQRDIFMLCRDAPVYQLNISIV